MVGDHRHELHAAFAARALQNVDLEGPLEQLGPRPVAAAARLAAMRAGRCRVVGGRGDGRGHDARAQLAGRSQNPCVAHGVQPRGGTEAARRQSSESGSRSMATVPSENGRLRAMRTRPSGPWVIRSWAMAGRRTYLQSASRPAGSRAPARVAACSVRGSMRSPSGPTRATSRDRAPTHEGRSRPRVASLHRGSSKKR